MHPNCRLGVLCPLFGNPELPKRHDSSDSDRYYSSRVLKLCKRELCFVDFDDKRKYYAKEKENESKDRQS